MEDKFIPYGKHFIDEDDIKQVVDVLKNGWLTQGPKVSEFENNIAEKVNSKYAVAVSSASAALHLATKVSGLKSGENLYTSANTFVASANCALYYNAIPNFIDIDIDTLNMSTRDLENKIKNDNEFKVIIPVHFAGAPCDMKLIQEISGKNSVIIEDASHALGGFYKCGRPIGSSVYSDMTIFSLHPVKGVTAGEGGIITTNSLSIARKLRMLRSHGIYKGNFDFPGISVSDKNIINTSEAFENNELNPWYYEMQDLGYNYRITDIQCALAISQLRKLDNFITRRKSICKLYDELLVKSKFVHPTQIELRKNSAHHLYVVRIEFDKLDQSRSMVMKKLFKKNIGTQVHYIPVPMHPYYKKLGYKIEDYPVTKKYYDQALSLPIYFGLDDSLVEKISKIVNNL